MFNIENKQTNKKNTEELTIIAKTQNSELQFMSQSMVTNNTHQVPNSTPDTFDTSTPKVNNNQNIRYIRNNITQNELCRHRQLYQCNKK